MLQKLSHHIAACLDRAADCRRRAEQTIAPVMKADLLDMETRWTHLARNYEFVESLERFVLSAKDCEARNSGMTRPTPTKTDTRGRPRCRRCGGTMRLFGIEPHPAVDRSVLHTYVCERCDSVETSMTPRGRRTSATGKKAAAPTIALLANKAFDDAATSRLGEAYEAAWRRLKASGSPLADKSHAASTRERLAKCILDMGQRGVTDSNRLAEKALLRLTSSNGATAPSSDH